MLDNIDTLKRLLRIGVYSNLEAIVTLIETTNIDSETLAKLMNKNTQEERLAILGAVNMHSGDEDAALVKDAIDIVLKRKLVALKINVRKNAYKEYLDSLDLLTLEELASLINNGEDVDKMDEVCLALIDEKLSSIEPLAKCDSLNKLLLEERISFEGLDQFKMKF